MGGGRRASWRSDGNSRKPKNVFKKIKNQTNSLAWALVVKPSFTNNVK